ncbi:MAG: hypothetical protein AAF993_17995 [Pseudomonadota bacterium]
MTDLDTLLAWATKLPSTTNEADYHTLWHEHCAPLLRADDSDDVSYFQLAHLGGLCADRLAWVFIAGYQAAIRRTFVRRQFAEWTAFAVSESADSQQLPGVTWREGAGGLICSGYKTWVASSRFVRHIVVKAGRGKQARYVVVDTQADGVTLSHKTAPGMLPDLSQGQISLNELVVPMADLLDSTDVESFGGFEKLYIFVAFLAYALRVCVAPASQSSEAAASIAAMSSTGDSSQMIDQIRGALDLAQALHAAPSPGADPRFADLAEVVQQLRRSLSGQVFAKDAEWQRDQKLIAMYR